MKEANRIFNNHRANDFCYTKFDLKTYSMLNIEYWQESDMLKSQSLGYRLGAKECNHFSLRLLVLSKLKSISKFYLRMTMVQ